MRSSSLKHLYEKHHQAVFSLSMHYLGNCEEAEDIVVEVFIKLGKHIEKVEEEKAKSWLLRTTVTTCIDLKRSFKRKMNMLAHLFHVQTRKQQESEGRKLGLELDEEVRSLLELLNEKERMVILLKYLEELDNIEISEVLGIKVGTVKSLIHRSLAKLRQSQNLAKRLAWNQKN